jgi:hypothetical protein
MPNGSDCNWIRFCAAVDGFRYRFGEWPSVVRLGSGYVADLQHILGDKGFETLQEKLTLRIDEQANFIAEDEAGRTYDYSSEGFSPEQPSPSAIEWLEGSLEPGTL